MYQDYKIKYIKNFAQSEAAKQFLKQNHYLKALPRGCSKIFGLFLKTEKGYKLSGLAAFGYPVGRGIDGKSVTELKRFALDSSCKKNTGSWFLSKCHKVLKKYTKFTEVISYADPQQGHEGTLYKAANYNYLGKQKQATQVINYNGQILNAGNVYRYKKHKNIAKLYKLGKLKAVSLPKKHVFKYKLK